MEQVDWEVLLQKMQERLRVMNEIRQATEELQQALNLNDKVSVQIWLESRAAAMEKADRGLEEMNWLLAKSADLYQKEQIGKLIKGEEAEPAVMELPEATRLLEIGKTVHRILEDTIEKDRRMNTRLAGEKSFYQ